MRAYIFRTEYDEGAEVWVAESPNVSDARSQGLTEWEALHNLVDSIEAVRDARDNEEDVA